MMDYRELRIKLVDLSQRLHSVQDVIEDRGIKLRYSDAICLDKNFYDIRETMVEILNNVPKEGIIKNCLIEPDYTSLNTMKESLTKAKQESDNFSHILISIDELLAILELAIGATQHGA